MSLSTRPDWQGRQRDGAIDTFSADGERLIRFDRAERWLHGLNGALVLLVMFTGAVLYFGPLSALVGRRALMKDIHVYCGIALPLPVLATLAGRWGRGFRHDVARLTHWTTDDSRWLRSRGRSIHVRLGKFNAGQKINSIVMAGVLPTLLLTGSVMKWFEPFPDSWRTGATYVHDLGAWTVWIFVTGHILKALNEPEQLRSMRTGWVPTAWARQHRPRWYEAARERRQESPPTP